MEENSSITRVMEGRRGGKNSESYRWQRRRYYSGNKYLYIYVYNLYMYI